MADRLNEDEPRRRQSGLLDAIFDVVEQAPDEAPKADQSMFRAKALEQIDVPSQVDQLLPLTSRMTWIALVAAALVILAGLLYAASTQRVEAVTTQGRAVNLPGLAVVSSPATGQIDDVAVAPGAHVTTNEEIATGTTTTGGQIDLRSPITGTVWQEIVPIGGAVSVGEEVATILPGGKNSTVLAPVPESQQSLVDKGQSVELTRSNGEVVEGTVADVVAETLPASALGELVGIPSNSDALQVMVVIDTETALDAGEPIDVKIIQSRRSLLRQLFEFR